MGVVKSERTGKWSSGVSTLVSCCALQVAPKRAEMIGCKYTFFTKHTPHSCTNGPATEIHRQRSMEQCPVSESKALGRVAPRNERFCPKMWYGGAWKAR